MKKQYTCAYCGTKFEVKAKCFPFCSDRCKNLDLGKWASEEYRLPAESGALTLSDSDTDSEETRNIH